MGKFDGILLATDYDDTFYATDFSISRENREAAAYFMSEGGYFTISTGRSLVNFSVQMRREALQVNAPVILSNGAQIYDYQTERLLYEGLLRAEVTRDMAQVCRRFPRLGFEAYQGECIYLHNPNEVTRRHLERAGTTGIELPILEMPVRWIKAMLQHTDREMLGEIQAYVTEQFGDYYEAIFSNPVLLELTDKGSHKGTAVLRLAEYLGVSQKGIICVGNGQNDLPMLEVASIAYAPENCAPALREFGVRMLPSCDDSCVARLIEGLAEALSGKQEEEKTPN